MKIQGYKFAIDWIAQNDSCASDHSVEDIQNYISVALVTDLYGKSQHQVACDVFKRRQQEKDWANRLKAKRLHPDTSDNRFYSPLEVI